MKKTGKIQMIFDFENWLWKFWHFLKPPHYTNSQNSMISFDYSWFLAINLSNFVSLPSKLHNWYYHAGRLNFPTTR